MAGLGRIDVDDGRTSLVAKTMKQKTKAGRDENRETMAFLAMVLAMVLAKQVMM
jgi:hypothetical protein